MSAHPNALRLVTRTLASLIRPPEPLPFEVWIEREVELIDGPYAGSPFSFSGAPALREIAQCLNEDHPANEVTVRKGQQSGVTTLAEAWCLYIASRMPANTLYALPGIDALRTLNSTKLQPLIDAWHQKIGRTVILPQVSRGGIGSTTYEKKFAGGYLALANANAVMDLSMNTARFGVQDEVSKWQEIPGFGDPEELFDGRFTAFRRTRTYKKFRFSTPEIDSGDETGEGEGHCRIDRHFRRSDQRYWNVPCPECGQLFVHKPDRFIIDLKHPHKSVYQHECGHHISEPERVIAVRSGHWKPTVDVPNHPGFHYDAFVSLLMSFEAIAEDTIRAKSELQKKSLANLVYALPYRFKGDAPEWEKLRARVEPHLKRGHVSAKGLLLVAFADVQMRGLWIEVVAFAPNGESWSVDAFYIDGDTARSEGPVFEQLRKETLDRKFPDAFGQTRSIDALGIDTGYRTHVVYDWVRKAQRAHPETGREIILATDGLDGWGRPALGQPKLRDIDLDGQKVKQGVKVWGMGTWPLKATVYSDLRVTLPEGATPATAPDSYCHFGSWNDDVYFKQLTAERLADIKVKGIVRGSRWEKTRENHYLDCRVGCRALAEYLGLGSMTPDQWAQLALRRGLPPELSEPTLFTPRASAAVVDGRDAQATIDRRKAAEKAATTNAPSRAAWRERTQGWWNRR